MSDIFVPLAGASGPVLASRPHPVDPSAVVSRTNARQHLKRARLFGDHPHESAPIPTNKFYTNLLLGEQACAAWTHPYSVSWAKGRGNARSWGLSISHIDRHQLAIGPTKPETGASQYFLNPLEIYSLVLSAGGLGPDTRMTIDDPMVFGARATFSPQAGASPLMSVPLVQGMAFVTAVYSSATPLLQSNVFFRSLDQAGSVNEGKTEKYKAVLEDGTTWVVYVSADNGQAIGLALSQDRLSLAPSPSSGPFSGSVQVAKLPGGQGEDIYDPAAGTYPIGCHLSAETSGPDGTYRFSWDKGGNTSRELLMFALPHHIGSFSSKTQKGIRNLQLQTTTKGVAVAVVGDEWVMEERLPVDIDFAPWTPENGSITNLPQSAHEKIIKAAEAEIEQDVHAQSVLDSMYFSGKGLAKFAMIAYVLHDLVGQPDMANKCLDKVKNALDVFVLNNQPHKLAYDDRWKGIVSTAGLGGDSGADFGNSWYNDHHFHYGYFVYTAAVVAHIDSSWLGQVPDGHNSTRADWINMLVADFANPGNDDRFSFSRSFDWFSGHSWAKGLFESADGKDQESTSEDGFASYALKMWGKESGDRALEDRGNLMLAIQARTFSDYFLMESDNKIQPAEFIGNKVTGILFENKADHATYFGMNIEYIQGIHMIPLNPTSAYTRRSKFVREEWGHYFSNGRVDSVEDGWRGILYANLALIDPEAAYNFFASPDFNHGWLDGGASLTWYLAYCAALMAGTGGGRRVKEGGEGREPDTPSVSSGSVQEVVVTEERTRDVLKRHLKGLFR